MGFGKFLGVLVGGAVAIVAAPVVLTVAATAGAAALAAGTVVAGAATTAAAAAGTAVASTAVGSAVVGAAATAGTAIASSTVGGAVASAAASASVTATAAGTAIASSSVGGAVASAAASAGTTATAAGTAIASSSLVGATTALEVGVAGTIGATTAYSGMNVIEGISNNSEAKKAIESAERLYNKHMTILEAEKENTAKKFEALNLKKMEIYANDIEKSIQIIKCIKIPKETSVDLKSENLDDFLSTKSLNQMETAAKSSVNVLKEVANGANLMYAASSSALALTSLLGVASTGTAISSLSGAAAYNATIAVLGGGALSAGGGGMALGHAVLGGITLAPAAVVASWSYAKNSEKKLTEAKRHYANIAKEVAQIECVVVSLRDGINIRIQEISDTIDRLINFYRTTIFPKFVEIYERNKNQQGKVDYKSCSEEDKEHIKLTAFYLKKIKSILAAKVLNEVGNPSEESELNIREIQGSLAGEDSRFNNPDNQSGFLGKSDTDKLKVSCSICGKSMTKWIVDDHDNKYCSEKCFETTFPKCEICHRPMKQWTEDQKGRKFCSETCYEKVLDQCSICGVPMKEWIVDDDDNKYCSQKCFEQVLPKCEVCHKPMKQWTEDEQGKKYCSSQCYKMSWPKCYNCNKPMDRWIEDGNGRKYCSEKCAK